MDEKLKRVLKEKYNPEGSNRREGQLRMLEMLIFFDAFCDKHGLRYWLDGGTILGAIRHGGFIPWDDDLDVDMPYQDCQKLESLIGRNKIGNYVLQTHKTDKGYFRFWPVLRDTKSLYVHEDNIYTEQTLNFKGCQIDIFPVVPKYNSFIMKVNMFTKKVVNYIWEKESKNGVLFLTKLVFFFAKYIIYPILRVLSRSKSEHLTFDFGIGFINEDRMYSEIFPLSEVIFEGHKFKAPHNPLAYCKRIYGENCMGMPSGEMIYNHHVNIKFFE